MNKVLIVITSYRRKADRVYSGADEWSDGWRFSDREQQKLRKKSATKPIAVKEINELGSEPVTDDTIIWIRGRESSIFPSAEIAKLIVKLRQTNDVYLTHHDEFVGDKIAKEMGGERNRILPYSLSSSANPEGFKAIMKTDKRNRNQMYLDAEAGFDELFRCFFLNPTDVFALVLHKMGNVFGSLDLDLQYYESENFKAQVWKQLEADYKGGRASEKLQECRSVIYKNPINLKRLYEAQYISLPQDKRTELKNGWEKLTRLFPEEANMPAPASDPLYLEVELVILGLDDGVERQVKKNFDGGNKFRKWRTELEKVVDEIKEVIMTANPEAVGV